MMAVPELLTQIREGKKGGTKKAQTTDRSEPTVKKRSVSGGTSGIGQSALAPAKYRDHLILALNLQPNDGVIDLTNHIDRGEYVAGGAFGQVHEGRWKSVDKSIAQILPRVAVKVIPLPRPRSQNERNERYKIMQRERKLWSRINHDNILPLIGFAHIDGDPNLPAFISPWIKNGTVMEYLKDNPHSSPFGFLEDIIEGLYYLHTFNPEIVHGDIKSANVLVNDCGKACLCDFGLSRFTGDNTLCGTSASSAPGTTRWMAPELLDGDVSVVTKEADIYAYGMTCWEILAGQIPFKSINDLNVAPRVIAGERPERILERHPDKIWQIIIKCWMNDSSNRPTTIAVLLSVEAAVASTVSENANVKVNPDVYAVPHSLSAVITPTGARREPAGEYYLSVPSPSKYVSGDGITKDSALPSVSPTTKHSQIRFDITTPIYNALTHLSPHSLIYSYECYPSAAHLFEAFKYLGGPHDFLAELIRHASDLAELNALALSLQKYVREDWEEVMLNKMEGVLYLKFTQHPNLSGLLLGTGMAELIYVEVADDFWGSGPHGRGANQLGLVLMRVRDRVRRAR